MEDMKNLASYAKWQRPAFAAKPRVWLTTDEFMIRDITPDLEPYVIDHMVEFFVREEPLNKSTKMSEDAVSVQELVSLWRDFMLPQRVSIVALPLGSPGCDLAPVCSLNPPTILGANMLNVVTKFDLPMPPLEQIYKGRATSLALGTVTAVSSMVDVFKEFGVDTYLDAAGLSVSPLVRGKGLGLLLLRARLKLCDALNIPVTKTVFTALPSQRIAEKAGFKILFEKDYDDFRQPNGEPTFPNMAPTRTIQLRAVYV